MTDQQLSPFNVLRMMEMNLYFCDNFLFFDTCMQVSNLKDMIAKKDEELHKFQNVYGMQKRGLNNVRFESSSPRRHSLGGASPITPRRRQGSGVLVRATSDSADERRHQNESRSLSKFSGGVQRQ